MNDHKPLRFARWLHIGLFVLVFAFMFVFCLFFNRTTISNYDKDLKKFPEFSVESLLSGDYTSEITLYFSDTIHDRDRFIDNNARIRQFYGFTEEEEHFQVKPGGPDIPDFEDFEDFEQPDFSDDPSEPDTSDASSIPEESSQDSSSEDPNGETSQKPEPPVGGDVELAANVLIMNLNGLPRAMELFYGNTKNAAKYAETLNAFASTLDPDVNVYSMVIPKQCAYYLQYAKNEKYAKLAPRTTDNLAAISGALSSRVKEVDVYGALLPHTHEDIYFRTDHHWTALGAYYGAQSFAQAAGVTFDGLDSYTKNVRPGYVGTMYNYTNKDPRILNNPEDFVTYIPSRAYTASYYTHDMQFKMEESLFFHFSASKRSAWYSTFIHGDSYAVHVVSDSCKNGRRLLLVKDSYGNPLPAYLLASFEEIVVVDARKYQPALRGVMEQYGITDVLFAECAYSAVGAEYIRNLIRLTQ